MNQEKGEATSLLEKLERHVGANFPFMFLHFNEYGPQAVLLLQQMRNQKRMLGPYSELTPYIENDLDAMESAILATASMEGKMRNSFLIDRMAVYNKIEGDPNAKKPGLFGGFGGGGGDNGKQQQGGNPFGA